ncbi:hypothetical protein SSX86_007693 [Deinandra increscens subsp. villosa]|uniref:Amine oxidase n=1 Tax=Deinandra increscens subsp. villosa TaxID=3103831 RepID=A0AAP0DEC2_9ASTR
MWTSPKKKSFHPFFPVEYATTIDADFLQFCASHAIFSVEDFLVHDVFVFVASAEKLSYSDRLKQDAVEYAECEAVVKKRGIDDMDLLMVDAWCVGYHSKADAPSRRLAKPLIFCRTESDSPMENGYARPVEGISVLVDMQNMIEEFKKFASEGIEWEQQETITLFTADGLVQIGGLMVPKRVSSSRVQEAMTVGFESMESKVSWYRSGAFQKEIQLIQNV